MIDESAALINKNNWSIICTTADAKKAPIVRGKTSWKSSKNFVEPTHDVLQAARDGKRLVAALTPPDIFVVDIDDKKALKPLCKAVHVNLLTTTLAVRSGAGYHLYYKRPKNLEIRKLKGKVDLFEQIDLRQNGYMIIPPSLHWRGKRHYEHIKNGFMTPQKMPKLFRKYLEKCYTELTLSKKYLTQNDVKQLSGNKGNRVYIDIDILAQALDALSPSLYDNIEDWFRLLASVHHATGGKKEARELFLEWARNDDRYTDSEHLEANRRMWDNCRT